MIDIHNEARKIKGRFTHSFDHPCGAAFIMKHERGVVQVAIDVIAEMRVDLIVELGTFRGGFTKLLEDTMPEVEIHTYDNVNETKVVRKHFGENVTFHVKDVLVRCPSLMALLERPERKLLYCDNGRKRQEVAMYSWQLNEGDFIGVHDWGNEIWLKDVKDYLLHWPHFGWKKLEAKGQTSRFWRKPK
jgi:hypothetical protein